MLGHMQCIPQPMSAEDRGASVAQLSFHLECRKGLALDNKDRAPIQRRIIHRIPRTETSRLLIYFEPIRSVEG